MNTAHLGPLGMLVASVLEIHTPMTDPWDDCTDPKLEKKKGAKSNTDSYWRWLQIKILLCEPQKSGPTQLKYPNHIKVIWVATRNIRDVCFSSQKNIGVQSVVTKAHSVCHGAK